MREENLTPTGIQTRTFLPVAICYIDKAIPARY
jgi:hypothetical protein